MAAYTCIFLILTDLLGLMCTCMFIYTKVKAKHHVFSWILVCIILFITKNYTIHKLKNIYISKIYIYTCVYVDNFKQWIIFSILSFLYLFFKHNGVAMFPNSKDYMP